VVVVAGVVVAGGVSEYLSSLKGAKACQDIERWKTDGHFLLRSQTKNLIEASCHILCVFGITMPGS